MCSHLFVVREETRLHRVGGELKLKTPKLHSVITPYTRIRSTLFYLIVSVVKTIVKQLSILLLNIMSYHRNRLEIKW